MYNDLRQKRSRTGDLSPHSVVQASDLFHRSRKSSCIVRVRSTFARLVTTLHRSVSCQGHSYALTVQRLAAFRTTAIVTACRAGEEPVKAVMFLWGLAAE